MKKKISLTLLILINITYFCYSQPPVKRFEKAEAALVSYLTTELSLTSEESQKFFPIYKTYHEEIRSVRKEEKGDQIELEEKVLNIRKKYRDDFKKVLGSDERVTKLLVAEKNFRELLRKELMKRRMNRQ